MIVEVLQAAVARDENMPGPVHAALLQAEPERLDELHALFLRASAEDIARALLT